MNRRIRVLYGRVVSSSLLQGTCIALLFVGIMLRLAVFKEI